MKCVITHRRKRGDFWDEMDLREFGLDSKRKRGDFELGK
jgi:hypothetical protein